MQAFALPVVDVLDVLEVELVKAEDEGVLYTHKESSVSSYEREKRS